MRALPSVTGLLLIAGAGAACSGADPEASEGTFVPQGVHGVPAEPPNIVLLLLDDLDATTSPYWDALTRTDVVMRSQGVSFANAFAPTPICCPARASILTGKYGHNTGVLTNGGELGGWPSFVEHGNEEHTIATYLDAAGYATFFAGKYLNGIDEEPLHIPPGWDEWYAGGIDRFSFYTGYGYAMNHNGTRVEYGNEEADYQTDVISGIAVDFIERAETDDERPFLMVVAPTAPHLPIRPARRHRSHPWANAEVPKTPNYFEADLSDKPLWLQLSGPARDRMRRWTTRDFRNRMGSLLAIDEMIDAVVAALDAAGELDRTYIVLTSDNGYNNGSHRLVHKMAPYEESLRIPMVVAGPGVLPATSDDRFALLIDLAPTFLDLAGLAVPDDMDGRSLVPLLLGPSPSSWRGDFIAQYHSGGALNGVGAEIPDAFWYLITSGDIPGYRALRNAEHLFVEWHDADDPGRPHAYEIYDLASDPFQLNNLLGSLAGKWEHRQLKADLVSRLEELSACSGPDCRE